MPRMTSPAGAVVNVTDDKAQWLLKQGYAPVEKPKKAPAKKATPSKTDQK